MTFQPTPQETKDMAELEKARAEARTAAAKNKKRDALLALAVLERLEGR